MKGILHAEIDVLVERARVSPRRRQHLNIHEHHGDPCQRLFNAIGVDSYIRPHRHCIDRRVETLIAVRGSFALLRFGGNGKILDVARFSASTFNSHVPARVGLEVDPEDWHTVLALEDGAVLLEVKAGPFDPAAAKEYAPWAPAEGSREALGYFMFLRRAAGVVAE